MQRAARVAGALGALFEKTRVPVIAIATCGEFVAANDAAVEQYGYSLAELLELRVHDLQASPRNIDGDLAHAHRNEEAPLERRPHRRKDGSILWVAPTAGPIDAEGLALVVSVLKDVTALVGAEERIRTAAEHSRRDRRVVKTAVTSMLQTREPRSVLEALALAFGQATGLAASAWVAEAARDEVHANGPPAGRRLLKMVATYESSSREPMAMTGEALDLDVESLGRRAWDEGRALLVHVADTEPGSMEHAHALRVGDRAFVAPLLGRGGACGLVYGVLAPDDDAEAMLAAATTLGEFGGIVLEAMQLEQRAARDSERAELMWQSAIEHTSSGYALLDGERRLLRVNRALCELLKQDAKDLVGMHCFEVFASCRGNCAHLVAMTGKKRVPREIIDAISGKPLRYEVIPAHANQSGIATIHVAHDLSEERAVRSQLVTADRLATIGRLAAGVAHEVNNPAGFVTLALQLVKDQLSPSRLRETEGSGKMADVRAMLDDALGAMLQINQIMRDLTGFSRERARSPIELTSVANSAIRLASHETRERATVVRAFDEGVVAHVRGARIAQVMLNLIVNAAQATDGRNLAHNRIEVRVYREGNEARVDVTDTGSGVAADVGDRIFEPFFTTREAAGGTGLGLWLSRSIIEEEGGALTYENLEAGGARFRITLPLYAAEGAAERVFAKADAAQSGA